MRTDIERLLFNAECIRADQFPDFDRTDASFAELISLNDNENEYVYILLKECEKMGQYLEVVFYSRKRWWDTDHKRFIFQKGRMLREWDEKEFLYLTRQTSFIMDTRGRLRSFAALKKYCPEVHIKVSGTEVGNVLEKMYYTIFRSGPREILYKSGFDMLAYVLDDCEDYNMVGASPSAILGMPIKLMRFLYDNDRIPSIMDSDSRERVSEIYKRFSSYFDKGIPRYFQWKYLEENCWDEEKGLDGFDARMFRRLKDVEGDCFYRLYKRYHMLDKLLGRYNPFRSIPDKDALLISVMRMDKIKYFTSDMPDLDRGIREISSSHRYECPVADFELVYPMSVMDLVDEALSQNNCLLDYIRNMADGWTQIVFVRKKSAPDSSFVTMEVKGRTIRQLCGRFNEHPGDDVIAFAQTVADKNGLVFGLEDAFDDF